ATIRQLGSATGAVVNGGVGKEVMVLVFMAVLIFWCVLMLVVVRFRANWRASAAVAGAMGTSATAKQSAGPDATTGSRAGQNDSVGSGAQGDDWHGVP